MLTEHYSKRLEDLILPREAYHPFPTAADRPGWDSLPDVVRTACIASGERHLGEPWPALPAALFMEYRRTGNRSRYERVHFQRRRALGALVIAECVEGSGRFLDEIVNGVWGICEESFWGIPAHNSARRFPGSPLPDTSEPIIDLFAGETASLLAWTHYLLVDRLDAVAPVVCDRIRREMKARILDPYLDRTDFWWMALEPSPERPHVNNWNPWCNSNCLAAALLLEDDPDRRIRAVDKALKSLDRFIDSYPSDGGCDEGTSYWSRAGGSLFDCLELLRGASAGRIDVYGEPLIADMGRYLYRAHISGDYFINFADGGAKVTIAADLVRRYGRRIGDERLVALGSDALRRHVTPGAGDLPDSLLRALPALFDDRPPDTKNGTRPPFIRDVWLDGLQVMAARTVDGSDAGLYVAAKGGHNAESHNHNDVGQFIVYLDGRPLIIDAGVETYTAQTFSSRRYEIWTMRSAFHNLPTVNGIQQAAGRSFAATHIRYDSDDSHAALALEIGGAYPDEAGIARWERTVRLDRDDTPAVSVTDQFDLARPSRVELSLMTPCRPLLDRPGEVTWPDRAGVVMEYPSTELEARYEELEIRDDRLRTVWGERLFRILLTPRTPVSEGTWVIRFRANE